MINELVVGENVRSQVFYCTNKTSGVSTTGNTYYSVTLQDKTGTIEGKIWEINESIAEFTAKNFIMIDGTVTSYKEQPQLKITRVTVVDVDSVNIADYCPISTHNIEEMWERLQKHIDSIQNEWYKELLNRLFTGEFLDTFKKVSAAKVVHHAFVGGLLEHTLAVTDICDQLAENYPKINRDLLLTAAICHDIGKTKEIACFPDNDYTDDGYLLGHIYMGTEMVDSIAKEIPNFPDMFIKQLKHCILAHHGAKEYGSPVNPSLIEALALSFADDTDAKLRRFSDLVDETSYNWSEKSDFFLNTRFRRTMN